MQYRGRDKFYKYKKAIDLIGFFLKFIPHRIKLFLFNQTRMVQGNVGLVIRYVLLKKLAKSIGDNVSIHPSVYIFHAEELDIGNNVSIHPMCYIEAQGGIKIGNDVSIAHAVTLLSGNHIYSDINTPIKDQGMSFSKTEIENNVWIGAKASILAGVKISSGSIIAAGAVVTKNTEINSIVGGIPASLIKYRV